MRVLTADCWSTWGAEVGAKVGMVGAHMHLPLGGARSDRIALCACGSSPVLLHVISYLTSEIA